MAHVFVTHGLGLRFESYPSQLRHGPLHSPAPRRAGEGSGENVKSSWEFAGWESASDILLLYSIIPENCEGEISAQTHSL